MASAARQGVWVTFLPSLSGNSGFLTGLFSWLSSGRRFHASLFSWLPSSRRFHASLFSWLPGSRRFHAVPPFGLPDGRRSRIMCPLARGSSASCEQQNEEEDCCFFCISDNPASPHFHSVLFPACYSRPVLPRPQSLGFTGLHSSDNSWDWFPSPS